MIIDSLLREHRNIEKLLLILEREASVFDRGERPDYQLIHAVISYFLVYPRAYHHPQEDMVFETLKARDPAAAAKIGDLTAEHRSGAERLQRVAQTVQNVLSDQILARQTVHDIIFDFIEHERRHIAMEDHVFFPAAVQALQREDWAQIASQLTDRKDPLFGDAVEARFDAVRSYILQLEQEAERERA